MNIEDLELILHPMVEDIKEAVGQWVMIHLLQFYQINIDLITFF